MLSAIHIEKIKTEECHRFTAINLLSSHYCGFCQPFHWAGELSNSKDAQTRYADIRAYLIKNYEEIFVWLYVTRLLINLASMKAVFSEAYARYHCVLRFCCLS